MTLADLMARYRPESWGRGETWAEHARRLWRDAPLYMAMLAAFMVLEDGWVAGPVTVNDGVVQDAHHRIVIADELGWADRQVLVRVV